ncbi:PDZ domain-containing protein [Actinomyces viscosus]|uniref:Periplasmic serine endoprotease DegP n=1 Tax=Actinomyces viscosus TaxID=1656 RepID=A0A448PLA4_ACTVI|nr:trypsin-like peptidase domain-containing protein [Actinomyces viscosus]TFH52581.1 PDZ domain-containing protein [Actinomyces viscosus]VEI16298.1 Periplasmic serine endoprotease DegP precursor [Actinomyces viscosus]
MSGYDETSSEAHRPTDPTLAAGDSHPGIGTQSATSQESSSAAASGSEAPEESSNQPLSISPSRSGYENLSQAYGADTSQPEPVLPSPAQTADAEHAERTRPLPADQPTSVYDRPARDSSPSYDAHQQDQYQSAQGRNPSPQYLQQQGPYPTSPQGLQAASYSQSSAQQPYQVQQAHLGSPYTSVPTTPDGYDAAHSEAHGAGASAGDAQAGPSGYEPVGAAGGSFYATSNVAGTQSGRSRRRGPGWFALVASFVVASLLGAGGAVGAIRYMDARGYGASSRSSAAPTAIATGDTTKTVDSTGQAPNWEAVSAAVSNAVVSIAVARTNRTALGSGVIFDKEGHIITNNHVVAGASQIQVTLADGRVYEAEITGTDPATDLAVIRLKDAPDNLTVAQLGDSDALTTGQDVMAIGNPLGLSSTVTTGIISALDRPVVNAQGEGGEGGSGSGSSSSAVYTNAIQIDAAINPGNSGGPLFDKKGRVIGITSSIATTGGSGSGESGGSGSIGIGFAIPVKLAEKVARQLIESGAATHAYLGVNLDTDAAEVDGTKRAGAKITSVESGSPADKAGLKKDDVVIAIDGKTTSQGSALTGYVRQYSANDKVKLTVIRESKQQDIDVTLAERKDS